MAAGARESKFESSKVDSSSTQSGLGLESSQLCKKVTTVPKPVYFWKSIDATDNGAEKYRGTAQLWCWATQSSEETCDGVKP